MTSGQMILMAGIYLAAFVAAAYFCRANWLRILGAAAGGAVFGLVALLACALAEAQGWWHIPKAASSSFNLLFCLGFAVSCSPVYLITWRVARRFGTRGLAICVVIAAVIGPPRDYAFAAAFPGWITFAPGIAPILGVSGVYALLVAVGHAVMRLVAGPARSDSLRGHSRPA